MTHIHTDKTFLYSQDAVYIDLGGSHAHTDKVQPDNTKQVSET